MGDAFAEAVSGSGVQLASKVPEKMNIFLQKNLVFVLNSF